ncbi:MAG TPA: hypothetical protein IAA20_03660 [Candidatus Enterococcus avicola]|uniref:Uncharacterized protein n=1 Tax=Candidatus Enterococcus avicola TaxID=2838561 RepID=A0A9D2JHX1_9ENTE|nr:hypothetical protein [Candidatus Enterococcus avicola]
MKLRSILLTSVAFVGFSTIGMGTIDTTVSANSNEQQQQAEIYNINDKTISLPTFSSNYQLTFHQPGMTYVTSNSDILVSSTGKVSTYFSTTAKVFVYRNGVLDHTITIIVGQG